jgi:hypothetical protein
MMVALLLFAYARGNRSSRGIERACVEDVGYRVVTGNVAPDHSTIADFRCRHEWPLGDVFSGVLGLCARAGLVSVGVVAIDGTKISANASMDANRDFGQIARGILAEAAETDRREDERYGSERGDELPEHLRTREGRRKALREAKERLDRERAEAAEAPADDESPVTVELDPGAFVTRPQGRRVWVREGRRALDAKREREARPVAKDRSDRLFEACRRLEEELDFDDAAHAAYDAWRARGVAADGSRRMAPGMVKPHEPVLAPTGTMNTTDHDSRVMRTQGQPPLQGYNAQLAVNDQQVIVAAELTTDAPDFGIWSRWSARRSANCTPSTSPSPPSWWPTPATGTSARSKPSSATASRSSSHPTPGYARPRARDGPAASMTSCAACSQHPTGARFTARARSPSSPSPAS